VATAIDQIRFEVVRNELTSATEAMAPTIRRIACSTTSKTRAEADGLVDQSNMDHGVLAAGTPM
jgi:hypothetical protein